MTSGITASKCRDCAHQAFPPRVWCPACGSAELAAVVVGAGEVTESTVLRRVVGGLLEEPVRIGAVRLDGGGIAIARLEQGCDSGDLVHLFEDDGAPVARPR
jgi:uncharacterized OB-fold protein